MIVEGYNYYYGAFLEKNGYDPKNFFAYDPTFRELGTLFDGAHALQPENPMAVKTNEKIGNLDLTVMIDRSKDRYESSKGLPEGETIYSWDYRRYVWSKKKLEEKYGDPDGFGANASNQWLVFSKNLYDKGFFEDKSTEEILEIESLLQDITGPMELLSIDRSNFHDFAKSIGASYDLRSTFYGNFDNGLELEEMYFMEKEDWQIEIESSTAALNYFCDNIVPEEYQSEFRKLIDEFHSFNSDNLDEDYQSPYERNGRKPYMWLAAQAKNNQNDYEKNRLEQVLKKQEEEQAFQNRITADYDDNEDKSVFLSEIKAYFNQLRRLQGTEQQILFDHFVGEDRRSSQNNHYNVSSDHMKEYWSKLFDLKAAE